MVRVRWLFIGLAILLSYMMCAVVAKNKEKMLWGIENAGYSAPASTAFLWGIPFIIGIVVCILMAVAIQKKIR